MSIFASRKSEMLHGMTSGDVGMLHIFLDAVEINFQFFTKICDPLLFFPETFTVFVLKNKFLCIYIL